jgi:hypothetical protein
VEALTMKKLLEDLDLGMASSQGMASVGFDYPF